MTMKRLLRSLSTTLRTAQPLTPTERVDSGATTATEMPSIDKYDLLILVDATASMGSFLTSLNHSLPQIISISALTNCFERIGLLAYRDYCHGPKILEWSGWTTPTEDSDEPDLVRLASTLRAIGGQSWPEAIKTGLARAYELMRSDATTLILHYADAPPHMKMDIGNAPYHYETEQKALLASLLPSDSYGGYGHLFADWASATRTLATGEKRAHVMCLLDDHNRGSYGGTHSGVFEFLSTGTGGACIHLSRPDPQLISEITIEMLLAWMGVRKEGLTTENVWTARLTWYPDAKTILRIKDESDPLFYDFVQKTSRYTEYASACVRAAPKVSPHVLQEHLPKKATPTQDFAKTYKSDEEYRVLVTKHLRQIIEKDVTAISLNPVFGSLWRAVCNDRDNESHQEMLDLFGRKVDEIRDTSQRAKMKAWLEESYDYTAEVLDTISSVPEAERFPCVCLDPTLAFTRPATDEDYDEEDSRPITDFRRDELLEIGRSCDYRILRRLGRVLTRLTFIDCSDAIPKHIAASVDADVPKIPLALASKQHRRKFWRILLHIVVPGTMLGGRAGAILAALVIRLGVTPLIKPAEEELLLWRDKWNTLDVPETWNVSCLTLLLDADTAFRSKDGASKLACDNGSVTLLHDHDRRLFERLIEYKMLESNLDTILTAQVTWTPEGTSMPVGPVVKCKVCQYPRSVTIMAQDSICGLCHFYSQNPMPDEKAEQIPQRVSRDDDENTLIPWYECNSQKCRAQYVVYHVEALNVRPKCHYCRVGEEAPLLECSKCLTRMIWPEEYRTAEPADAFVCMGCKSGRKTVVEVETTANTLREGDGQGWLLENKDGQIKQPFGNRSLFYVASNSQPLELFCKNVQVLPKFETELYHRGKTIQNAAALLQELRRWIDKRRTESGTCSLCFSNFRKAQLLPACGRSGCKQRLCHSCMSGWYGLNAPGLVINTAALHCPFCRRIPTAKTLARHGSGVQTVGNLKNAVTHSGEWIYGWCMDCGHAKQLMERVCAAGAQTDTTGWVCEECEEAKGCRKQVSRRQCPGCGIETEKAGGCDHIECHCGTHWCFFCGEKSTEDDIYDHMSTEHGGYYGGQYAEDYDSDDGTDL